MKNFRIILIVHGFMFLSYNLAKSQEFGGNPWNIRWQEIDTDTARIIFPMGLEKYAQRVANVVHFMAKNDKETIGKKHSKIDIVLQNQTLIPNGYVGLAPWRSEFFLNPLMNSQYLGSLPWHETLAIHEYRHVLQYSNSRVGLSKLFYVLFGQSGWAVSSFFAVPNWFWEGDAVAEETRWTPQGRGRLPLFYAQLHSLGSKKIVYNYMKSRNGSLRDLVPDHYRYGYLLNWYGRAKYSDDLWKYVFNNANRYDGIFYPFSQAIRLSTGNTTKKFYKLALQEYNKVLDSLNQSVTETPANRILPDDFRTVAYQKQTYMDSLGNKILFAESYKNIPAFVRLEEGRVGKPTVLTRPGLTIDDYFSFNQDKIVWAELRFHERRGYKDYSVIMIYDIKTKKKKQLTRRTKLLAPDIAHRTPRVVSVQTTPLLEYNLVITDAETGVSIDTIPNPDGLYYTYPKWSQSDQSIITPARKADGTMALLEVYMDGRYRALTPFTTQVIGPPYVSDNLVVFSSAINGSDEIYAYKWSDSALYQLTERKLQVYDPTVSPDETELFFSEYTHRGQKVYSMQLREALWKKVDITPLEKTPQFFVLPARTEQIYMLQRVPGRTYPTRRYNEWLHAVNVHTWFPVFDLVNLGVGIISENTVNTFRAQATSVYNLNNFSFNNELTLSYARAYPVVFLTMANSVDRHTPRVDTNTNKILGYQNSFINTVEASPGIMFPFNLSSNLYLRSLTVMHKIVLGYAYETIGLSRTITRNNFFYTAQYSSLQFWNIRKKAPQNTASVWSQYVSCTNTYTSNGYQLLKAEADVSLPGLFTNHSLVCMGAHQYNNALLRGYNFFFNDDFIYARGSRLTVPYTDITKASVNYLMNLVYPDFGFANLLYVKRIWINFFADYQFGNRFFKGLSGLERKDILPFEERSYGLALVFDTQFFNIRNTKFPFAITFGIFENEVSSHHSRNFFFNVGATVIRL